jgi:hypothetical protein
MKFVGTIICLLALLFIGFIALREGLHQETEKEKMIKALQHHFLKDTQNGTRFFLGHFVGLPCSTLFSISYGRFSKQYVSNINHLLPSQNGAT